MKCVFRLRWRPRLSHSTIAAVLAYLTAIQGPISAAQTPTPTPRGETQAVEGVLRAYREAVEALDVKRLKRLWPSVNEKALAKAFAEMEQQTLSFDGCVIGLSASRADATCTGNARIVPRVGNPAPHYLIGEWRFTLRKTDDGWVIQAVEARPN